MSWAAHQFETYAIQAHLPKKWVGGVSYLAIVAGDQLPDFVAKFWVYGVTIGGVHYGAEEPYKFHRGWPGAGFSHSLGFALLVAAIIWFTTRSRGWTAGVLLGMAAHNITDINDTVGTMLAFPFSTENYSLGTWAYAATPGGKYLDARAYYSSFGFVMDALWLVILLLSWRVLTERYWREVIVPADPKVWAWIGRRVPQRALLAIYRATFFYGLTRMIAWTSWAHIFDPDPLRGWDLTWGGPDWIPSFSLTESSMLTAGLVGVAFAVAVLFATSRIIGTRADAPPPSTLAD
ncbi:MAG: metal-dependent hydrolase [Acidimicrobiales bacterium]